MTNLAFIILAAGKGTRMNSTLPKVLHPIGGTPMLTHCLTAAAALNPQHIVLVTQHGAEEVEAAAAELNPTITCIRQGTPQGTGHAVKQALPALQNFSGTIVVLYADAPLITPQTLHHFLTEHQGSDVSVLTTNVTNPTGFGRIIRDENNQFLESIEEKDATDTQRHITEINTGILALNSAVATRLVHSIDNQNASGEYYLTDVLKIARLKNLQVGTVDGGDPLPLLGANDRTQLAKLETAFQNNLRQYHMTNGVTLLDPQTTYFSADTKIEPDVTIEPNVYFGKNVTIQTGVRIKAFSHIEGATIGENGQIGPFARLRPGTALAENTKIGNFVEVKNSTLGIDSKASHLTYIGDATVGSNVNIGGGTITANYHSIRQQKTRTKIEDSASIGANSTLVAPVTIGQGSFVGAGTTVRNDTAERALVVDKAPQMIKDNYNKGNK